MVSRRPNTRAIARLAAIATFLGGAAAAAGAQRAPSGKPVWWGSLWTGFKVGGQVFDAETESWWDFDIAPMLRLTLEREWASRLAVGASWSSARMPLTYEESAPGSCGRCQADATVTSFAALVRFAGRQAFHQVFEVNLGATRYANFERVTPKLPLPPAGANTDFSFGFGYGFGYTLSRDWQLVLVQEGLTGVHDRPRDGVAGGTRITRSYTTRIGARIGF